MNRIIGNRYYNFMVAINMHNTRKSWKRGMPDTACRNQNFLMPKYTMLISILYHNVTPTVIVFFLLSRLPLVHIDKLSDVVARTQWSASTLPDQWSTDKNCRYPVLYDQSIQRWPYSNEIFWKIFWFAL